MKTKLKGLEDIAIDVKKEQDEALRKQRHGKEDKSESKWTEELKKEFFDRQETKLRKKVRECH